MPAQPPGGAAIALQTAALPESHMPRSPGGVTDLLSGRAEPVDSGSLISHVTSRPFHRSESGTPMDPDEPLIRAALAQDRHGLGRRLARPTGNKIEIDQHLIFILFRRVSHKHQL